VALVAVVALVLAVGAAAAGAPGIVNAVGGAIARAVCLVGGGECRPPAPRACVVSSTDSSARAGVEIAFLKLGGHVGLLREERSDGTVRLTLVDDVEAGPTAGTGSRVMVELDGFVNARAGAMSEAELLARLGRRRSWEVASRDEADALERRIERSVAERVIPGRLLDIASKQLREVPADLPEPDESVLEGDLLASGAIRLALGDEARAGLQARLGATRDQRGTTRVTFAVEGEHSLHLRRALFGLRAEGAASAAVTVAFDRHGTAKELEVSAVADGDARIALPGDVPPEGAGRGTRGGRLEASGTLDLSAPGNAEVVERLLGALAPARVGDLPAAAAALARRIASSGTLQAEVRTTSRDAYSGAAKAGAGAVAGVSGEISRTSSRLRSAWWRPPGGVWDRRQDCTAHQA